MLTLEVGVVNIAVGVVNIAVGVVVNDGGWTGNEVGVACDFDGFIGLDCLGGRPLLPFAAEPTSHHITKERERGPLKPAEAAFGLSFRGISTLRLPEGVRETAGGGGGAREAGTGRGDGEFAGSGVPRDGFRPWVRAAFLGEGSVSFSPGFLTCG